MVVAEEYAHRLRLRETEVARLAKAHERIGNGRLALGAVIVLVAWGAVTTLALVGLGVLLLALGLAGWITALRRND